MTETINDAARFAAARQTLIDAYDRPEEVQHFTFPAVNTFNWARDWFDRYARNRADTAVAGPTLAGGWREVTYHQLSAASDSVALSLLTNGVKPGFRAAIDMPASVELYAVIVGVLKSCGVAIPIHHGLHPEALADRIEIADPQSVIAAARRFDRQTIDGIAPIDWSAAPQELPSAPLSADAPAFGCFTSGTTGRPKLALHSNRSHAVAHLSSMYWNRLDAGQRRLNVSSPGWAKFFWSSFLVPLTAGATVVIRPDDLTPEGLADFVVEHSVESVCAPVAFLRNCVFRDSGSGRPSIRDLTSVGEAVPEALRERIAQRWGTRVREGYGQTEATAILGELRARPGRWSVLPGYRVELTQYPGGAGTEIDLRRTTGRVLSRVPTAGWHCFAASPHSLRHPMVG